MAWSDAPEDVLLLLSEHPTFSVADRLRFSAVCKPWRAAATIARPGACLPYLLVPDGESKDDANGGLCNMFCPFDNKVYRRLRFPDEARGWRHFGSCYSWLAMADLDGKSRLLNPMSGAQVELPALSTLPEIVDVIDHPGGDGGWDSEAGRRRVMYVFDWLDPGGKPSGYDNVDIREWFLMKMCMSSPDPLSDSNCIIMAVYSGMRHLAFSKPGEKTWITLHTECHAFQDIIYHQGKFYAVNQPGIVVVVDFDDDFGSAKVRQVMPRTYAYEGWSKYLVGLPSGELLLVARFVDCERDPYQTLNFGVLKLDINCEQPEWVKVRSLDGWALFLGFSCSRAVLSSQVSGRCRGNCIYFTDDYQEGFYGKPFGGHDMGIFDMETKSIERFYPSESQLIMPPPVWILPRIR